MESLRRNCRAKLALLAIFVIAACAPALHGQNLSANSAPKALAAHLTIDSDLDASFDLLYNLKFAEARKRLVAWEQLHPSQSLGQALEAAADLFEEFHREGVLTSEFFLDDKRILGGIPDEPDPVLESGFIAAAQRAESEAREQLAAQPRDPDALFALTISESMRADNAFLFEKRRIEALRYLFASERDARILLQVAPDAIDADVPLGSINYIVGCLPIYERFFLGIGGVHGNKTLGMQELSGAAANGHYLRPFAKLLLALAALREHNSDLTRAELVELTGEYPDCPLYRDELAKLTPAMRANPSRNH